MFGTRRALIPVAIALACFAAAASAEAVYNASMDGAQNLPEPVKTEATGAVQFAISADGKSAAYKVTVNRLVNASAADLHLGQPTQNGPLVAKLFPNGTAAKKGEYSGVLAEGTLTGADLIGPLTGATLADLVEELKLGNVYVNVHTDDGIDPPNSGPGDYRLGEIRGQLK